MVWEQWTDEDGAFFSDPVAREGCRVCGFKALDQGVLLTPQDREEFGGVEFLWAASVEDLKGEPTAFTLAVEGTPFEPLTEEDCNRLGLPYNPEWPLTTLTWDHRGLVFGAWPTGEALEELKSELRY